MTERYFQYVKRGDGNTAHITITEGRLRETEFKKILEELTRDGLDAPTFDEWLPQWRAQNHAIEVAGSANRWWPIDDAPTPQIPGEFDDFPSSPI